MVRDYASAAPLSGIVSGELAPGDAMHSDQEVRDYIRASVSTLYHPTGTCAMGGDSPLHAARQPSVVDPQLRVRGVTGLRVVDASVFPTLPRGNTNAPTIAVAERAADLIIGRAPLASDPVDVVTSELIIAR
jgi:choline dehydrogenase